jgi:hypothetical protein
MPTNSALEKRLSPLWRPSFVAGAALVIAASLLYLATLDDGLRLEELRGGDLITHQYAQAEARLANAPGYPLYTMGGWLWLRLGRALLGAWLNPIQILSLYSTIYALAALAVFYLLLLQVTDGNWPLAFLGGAFYSVTYFFWYYAVTTENYSSAVLQTVLLILWAFRWQASPGRADRYLLYMAFVAGTCLAHLPTVLLILPPLLLYVLSARPDLLRRGKLVAQAFGLALLPLASYAYVYARGAQHPEWRGAGQWPDTWAWFVSFLSTQQGRDEMSWWLGPFTDEFPWLMARELTWPVLLVGLAGLAWLGRRRALFLYSTLALYFAFCYFDRYGNWFQVIMPMYPVIVLGMIVAADKLWRRAGPIPGWAVRGLLVLAIAALIGDRLAGNYPRADQSGRPDDDALAPGRAILADGPAPGAAIIGSFEERLSLDYLVHVWGERPDLYAAEPSELASLLERGGVPLDTTRLGVGGLPPEELEGLHLSSGGLNLIELRQRPLKSPPPSELAVGAEIGGELKLLGVDLLPPGEPERLHLALYWQALAEMRRDYTVSLRLTADGQPVAQQDHPPVWGAYPTRRWSVGEVVRDDYLLPVPPATPVDGLWVVVYHTPAGGGFDNLGEVRVHLPRQ